MKNKTVFDVNIWLSYFISGKSEKIIDMIENNDVFFYRSAQLMLELKEVINRNIEIIRIYCPSGLQYQ